VNYAKNLGVKMNDIILCQPDNGEQGLEVVERFTRSGLIDLIVIDSVANLVPKAEIEAAMDKTLPGLQARMMAKALRKLTAIAAKSNTTIIFINQVRMRIGVMFGNPETTPGGRALKFYCSMRLDIRRIGSVKEDGEAVANKTRVKIAKNKVAPPFKQCEFNIVFGEGIDTLDELLNLAVENKIITKSGSWYSHKGVNIGQGSKQVKAYFKSEPKALADVKSTVMLALFPPEEEVVKVSINEEESTT